MFSMSRARLRNEDEIFRRDIKTDNTFMIDTTFNYTEKLQDADIRRYNTIFSAKYGIEPGFDKELLDYAYACECKKTKGQDKVGLKCSLCGKVVKKIEFPVDKFGYMELPFIAPTTYCMHLLSEVMSKNDFESLLNGKTVFRNIYKDIDDILNAFGKKDKQVIIQFIRDNKNILFAKHVPIISAKLRQFSVTTVGKTEFDGWRDKKSKQAEQIKRQMKATTKKAYNIVAGEYNTPFTQLSMAINSYNEAYKNEIYKHCELIRFHIYRLIYSIYLETINMAFGSKAKIARDGVFAVRFPYTSIAVLAPLPEYSEMDSCSIPFETFRAAFQEEIKDILLNIFKLPLIKVHRMINLNRTLTAKEKRFIEECFDYIPDKVVYINRQPTIAWESILVLKVREIRDELVLRVHPLTLKGLRADFDGDSPFIVGLHVGIRKEFHKLFSPNANILQWNLKFNSMFGMINDYQAFVYEALDDGDE